MFLITLYLFSFKIGISLCIAILISFSASFSLPTFLSPSSVFSSISYFNSNSETCYILKLVSLINSGLSKITLFLIPFKIDDFCIFFLTSFSSFFSISVFLSPSSSSSSFSSSISILFYFVYNSGS